MGTFKDFAMRPIIAFDLDGTLTTKNIYPNFGPVRRYAQKVVNFLREIGVVVIIWTCRDDLDTDVAKGWLLDNGFEFDGFNSSEGFAPFRYEARKIYAHMYVDDQAFGWNGGSYILLQVMQEFLVRVVHVPTELARDAAFQIEQGGRPDVDGIKEYVHRWRMS